MQALSARLRASLGRGVFADEQALDLHDRTNQAQSEDPRADGASLPVSRDELIQEYVDAAREHIVSAQRGLLESEKPDHDRRDGIHLALRAFHTLKGSSALLELTSIEAVAHRAESVLQGVRDQDIAADPELIDLCLRCCDALEAMVEQIAQAQDATDCALPADYRCLLDELGQALGQTQDVAMPAEESHGPPPQAPRPDTRPSTVRVSTQRLDALINLVGELMVSHSLAVENPLVRSARQRRRRRALLKQGPDNASLMEHREDLLRLAKDLTGSNKLVSQLHDLAVALRMIPLRGVFEKAARLTRDISRKCGKELELECDGEETELDRSMVEMLYDPLVHMIRNAAVHGIEDPDQRRLSGKSPRAKLQLKGWNEAGEVVLSLSDDGRGLDVEAIRQKGVQRGLIGSDVELSPAQIQELIFHPGFSTAGQIDGLAGRGVGMDVVRRNIEAMRGRVEVYSQAGQGTEFRLRLPLTTAVEDVLALQSHGQTFLLATRAILRTMHTRDAGSRPIGDDGQVVIDQGQPIRLSDLGALVGLGQPRATARQAQVVIVSQGHRRTAILVDALLSQQRVVIKPLGRILSRLALFSSGAILGDGQVALVLDPRGLLEMACKGESLSALDVA